MRIEHGGPFDQLYNGLDKWRARAALENLGSADPDQILSSVPSQSLAVDRDGDRLRLRDDARQLLIDHELDVILVLAAQLSPSDTSALARFGAAAFVFGEHSSPLSWSGFDEVMSGNGLVTVRLELHRPGMDLPQSVTSVANAHPYSAARTRASAATHAIPLLERLLHLLHSGLMPDDVNAPPERNSRVRSQSVPTLSRLATIAARYMGRVTVGQSGIDPWYLGFSWDAAGATSSHPLGDITRYVPLRPPSGFFWADPFVVRDGERYFVLFEELKFTEERGYLRAMELGPNGALESPRTILDLPYHLSYPFVFEYEGSTYLLPEMSLEGRLELYRAVRLPYEWVLDRVIMDDAHLIDATIAQIDGRWWMFACRYLEGLAEWNDLVLFHADSPFGPWEPHRANPVVSDVRFARPAGSLYRADGQWFRPAQDCTHTYGGGIRIQRIVRLTETEYVEEEFSQIEAGGPPNGCHTVNRVGALSVIDLKVRNPRARARSH